MSNPAETVEDVKIAADKNTRQRFEEWKTKNPESAEKQEAKIALRKQQAADRHAPKPRPQAKTVKK